MNLGDALNIGRTGLLAASRGTQLSSQNLTNAATPGYTRRTLELDPVPLSHGGGVRAGQATRVIDPFLERRGLSARAFSGETDARVKTLAVIDTVFADGQGTVGEALDSFEAALSDLSNEPHSTAARLVVLERAQDLTTAFSREQESLQLARSDANQRISDDVETVNGQIDRIGELNVAIVAGKNARQDVGDLEDQRDQLIREVARSLPTQVIAYDTGAVSVILGGSRDLVSADGTVHHLESNFDATAGAVRIQRMTNGALEDITGLFTSGSIGGTIMARDGALQDAQTALDQLAYDIASAYNTQHAAGYALDGNTGRNLFTPIAAAGGAAAAFSVSADVLGQPSNLAAASAATSLPGDNRNALELVKLRDQNIGLGGTSTAQKAFTAMVAAAGSAAHTAQQQSEHADASLAQVDALRETVSGVSSDEEMMNIMKFQRAYQASLRVVEIADSMLSELIHMRAGG